jgi:hypothetical protein
MSLTARLFFKGEIAERGGLLGKDVFLVLVLGGIKIWVSDCACFSTKRLMRGYDRAEGQIMFVDWGAELETNVCSLWT